MLSEIDDFDDKATLKEKAKANRDVLTGEHISECSDSYGTFSSAIMRNPHHLIDSSRETEPVNAVRLENQPYHNLYNAAPSRLKTLKSVLLTSMLIYFAI